MDELVLCKGMASSGDTLMVKEYSNAGTDGPTNLRSATFLQGAARVIIQAITCRRSCGHICSPGEEV